MLMEWHDKVEDLARLHDERTAFEAFARRVALGFKLSHYQLRYKYGPKSPWGS